MITAPKRRWLRFGLRTMLAAVVIIAIPLAWIANERRHSRHEQQIAQNLRARGAYVGLVGSFDASDDDPFNPGENSSWWRKALSHMCGERVDVVLMPEYPTRGFNDLSQIADLQRIRCLNLDGSGVRELAPLARIQTLESLSITKTQVTDIAPLAGLENLTAISLRDTQVHDVTPLAGLHSLEFLGLSNTQVTDLAPLVQLKMLKWLDLRGTSIKEEQIRVLQNALPECGIEWDATNP